MTPGSLKKQAGFSLAELIVGLFLIGIAVLVVGNIPRAVGVIGSSQTESKIREVIAKKLEDIRLTGYDNLELETTQINDPALDNLSGLQATSVVTNCPVEVCPNGELVKRATITVSWSESGTPKLIQIVTLIAKDGLR